MKYLVILGTGGFAREVLSFLRDSDQYEIIGFTDPDPSRKGTFIDGIPVLGNDDVLLDLVKQEYAPYAFVAVGKSTIREFLFKKVCELGFRALNIIHPSAVIAPDVSLGEGIVVYPNVTINTNVRIRNSVLINSNVTVGHDVDIGDFVNVNPGVNIAGCVKIKKSVFLGIGCSVLENVIIGDNAVIGGGALVREDVSPDTKVVGLPARPLVSK